ncbi:MAG: hypothetical protein AB7S86_05765 [Hydrogenophaga sp.]|uniref:hypothetical protein n=1 Tax=Hydrogenophaga sp. TaxID=1904254 RepID=UPI003D10B64F
MATTVALLGGGSSGKATLAAALRRELALQAPDLVVAVMATDDISALTRPCPCDLTLLMGLDPPGGPLGASAATGEATDARLRHDLHAAGVAFQILYGDLAARVQQALRAIGHVLGRTLVQADPSLTAGRGRWTCENCSDPECEHRMFTGLLARRPDLAPLIQAESPSIWVEPPRLD